MDTETGIAVSLQVPIYRGLNGVNQHDVEIHVDPRRTTMDMAGQLIHSVIQQAHENVRDLRDDAELRRELKEQEEERRSLKRRRTDDDLQRDRRQRPNEEVDFDLSGAAPRLHVRMKRSDALGRGLDAFAERRNINVEHLKLFYGGRHVLPHETADDVGECLNELEDIGTDIATQLGLESGESLHVYQLVD